ncbi:aldo/keto reductase [Cellulomonas sp. P22]|uniref:aldo/keto reductase n=1 Tax=Cellulomonas sp. P22 TaxID=3373189 RepID=UPI00378D030C
MKQRRIGDVEVGEIGLGGMPMSIEGRPDRAQAIATVHAALDAGVTLIDTADSYHVRADEVGHNESLVAEALASWGGDTSHVLVATKGGHVRPGDGSWTVDGSREHLRAAVEGSLRRLGVEQIGLYQFHRPDPTVPWGESVGVLAELLDEGTIRMAGVSNANPAQIREAQQVLGGRLVSVQNQFSPYFRSSAQEIRVCTEMGLAFLAYSPLGGSSRASTLGDTRGALARSAVRHGVSPQQVALAWELAQSPVVIPIPGASRPGSIVDSVKASDLHLAPDEVTELNAE